MKTLKDLYYGNITPYDPGEQHTREYHQAKKQADQSEEAFAASLTDEQQKALDVFENDFVELSSITEMESFIRGFTLAARLMIEVLAPATDLLEA